MSGALTTLSAFTQPAGSVPVSYSDDFESGAENPIGAPWVSGPGVYIDVVQTSGGKLEGTGNGSAGVVNLAFAANQEATLTIDSANGFGPIVRGSTTTSVNYHIYTGSSGCSVQKTDAAGSDTQVGADITYGVTLSAGDTLTLRATGTSTVTLSVYINGVLQGSVTDSSSPITSGKPGYYANGYMDITAFSATDV